ncbi:MAG: DUF4332 domain-containing protein [Candidatus Helarchaeota archaeon]
MSKRKSTKKTTKKTASTPKITSKTPESSQIGSINEVEGIGTKYSRILKKVGINTTEDLRKGSLVEIVEATNLSPKLVYKWQCQADLFRLRRMAEEYSNLLFNMGIETVKEVSKQKASELHDKVTRFYEKAKKKPGWQGDVRKVPTEKDVQQWIDSAKELVAAAKDEVETSVKEKAKISSKTPDKGQVGDVIDIEGIGKETAKDLKEVGIETTEQLRRAPLVEVVEATGLSPKRLYKWICKADLFRIEDVDEEYSDLLFFAGIETVKEVSRQKISELTSRVRRAALKAKETGGWQGDIKRIPGKDTIRKWIKSAKELVKKS